MNISGTFYSPNGTVLLQQGLGSYLSHVFVIDLNVPRKR